MSAGPSSKITEAPAGETTALATRPETVVVTAADLMPVLSIEQSLQRYNAIVSFAKQVMKKGRDYGTIPGTEKKNDDGTPSSETDTLLKPGAEKLCTLFGLTPDFEDYRVVEDWEKGFFYYAYRCVLRRGTRVVAAAIGSANSREKKYRRDTRLCPACEKPKIVKSKYPPKGSPKGTPGGWFCNKKSGGCGAEFAHDDPAIVDQSVVSDPAAACDQVNTLQKMAQKRALVAVTLLATNASEFFTQDVEDMDLPRGNAGEVIEGEYTDAARDGNEPFAVDATFLKAWDEAAKRHDLSKELGRDVLGGMFRKRRLGFDDSTHAQRAAILDAFTKATPEQIETLKKKAEADAAAANAPTTTQATEPVSATTQGAAQPTQSEASTSAPLTTNEGEQEPEPPLTPALVRTWEDTCVAAMASAERRNVADGVIERGITAYVQRLGKTRKTNEITERARLEFIAAIRDGRFDYESGAIRQADAAKKAS